MAFSSASLPPAALLVAFVFACTPGSVGDDSTGTSDTDEPTAGPEPTSTTDPGDTGEHVPVDCIVVPQTHPEACPGEPCPITVDVAFECDDFTYGAPGLRVAAGSELSWLVTSSETDAMLFSADPNGAQRLDVLPPRYSREGITLATDPAGELHALASASPILGPGAKLIAPGATFHVDPDGVIHEVAGASAILLAFEIDDGSKLRAWGSDGPGEFAEGVADGDTWSWSPTQPPTSVGWERFGLTREGATLATGIDGDYNTWRLMVRVGGAEQQIGSTWVSEFPGVYWLSAPVPKAASAAPPLAIAMQHDANLFMQIEADLRVVWPADDSYESLTLPDTGALRPTCIYGGGEPPNCEGSCHETASGFEEGAFALAVTDDGFGWLVHVTTNLDQQYTYEPELVVDDLEACAHRLLSDQSTGVLHLTRIDFATREATEVLTQPIGRPALEDLFLDFDFTPPRAVDLRARGTSLVIGVRTTDPAVRLLRVETAMLP